MNLKDLPLFGGCADAYKRDYWEAFEEVLANLFVATLPIWFGIVVLRLTGKQNLINAFYLTTGNGELFIYSATVLAPIAWMIWKKHRGAEDLINIVSLSYGLIFVITVSSGVFALQRAGIALDESFAFWFSISIFFFSVVIFYLTTLYRISRDNLLRKHTEREKYKTDEYAKHRAKMLKENDNE